MKGPLVSVVLPFFNSERHLFAAIQSCLSQSYRNIEIIGVDDGSVDASADLFRYATRECHHVKCKLIRHPGGKNLGLAASRLLGFRHSSGQFISLLDSDDAWHCTKIEKQLALICSDPSIVVCHTAVKIVSDSWEACDFSGRESQFSSSPSTPYSFQFANDFLIRLRICNSSAMIRANSLRSVHYPGLMSSYNEDWLLWVLLSRKGRFIQCPEKLTTYRVRSDSLSVIAYSDPGLQRLYRIEFLVLVTAYTFPALASLRSFVLLLRSLAGLYRYHIRLKEPVFPAFH